MGGREAIHFITQGRTAAHASLDKGRETRLTQHLAGFARRAAWRYGNTPSTSTDDTMLFDIAHDVRCQSGR